MKTVQEELTETQRLISTIDIIMSLKFENNFEEYQDSFQFILTSWRAAKCDSVTRYATYLGINKHVFRMILAIATDMETTGHEQVKEVK